mmetsp:Transcript_13941/g.48553  ORF Transcript_13941/g.48553 Transcript_13941/m.48553 type:complete len:261 (+) Transcript_13941:3589-4371(+)
MRVMAATEMSRTSAPFGNGADFGVPISAPMLNEGVVSSVSTTYTTSLPCLSSTVYRTWYDLSTAPPSSRGCSHSMRTVLPVVAATRQEVGALAFRSVRATCTVFERSERPLLDTATTKMLLTVAPAGNGSLGGEPSLLPSTNSVSLLFVLMLYSSPSTMYVMRCDRTAGPTGLIQLSGIVCRVPPPAVSSSGAAGGTSWRVISAISMSLGASAARAPPSPGFSHGPSPALLIARTLMRRIGVPAIIGPTAGSPVPSPSVK